jgi:hypothetical protein
MILALTFATPLLLLGLLASLIPLALHLLSSVRAQETYFPTLRFLQRSMEKTARRRRIQHWLLLLLRMGLLALLALSVAEPISDAVGGWFSGRRYATVIVLDNSLSMGARSEATSRFDRARTEATALLGLDTKPALAALLTTNGGLVSTSLTSQLDTLRDGINRSSVGAGRAPIRQRLEDAIEMLRDDTTPQKSIYVFSDLQRISFEEVAQMTDLAEANDIHLLIVNVAEPTVSNVGITDLEITGRQVIDEIIEITATLMNSSSTDRKVNVALRIDGRETGQRIRKTLRKAGTEGDSTTVRFRHRFVEAGPVSGEVLIDRADDLALDNVRRFSLLIGGRIRALVVRGRTGPLDSPVLDPAMMLTVALDPYGTDETPWSITPATVESDALSATSLAGMDVAYFCNVPSFTAAQARAVADFVKDGGTAVLFPGPDVQIDNYNERFLQAIPTEGGLLPGRLVEAVGEIGPDAQAVPVEWVDLQHPYFQGFYENHADYLSVLVQRYYRLGSSARPGEVLMRLKNGDPLLQTKRFGHGRVVLCATGASPRWSNLPITGLFLPLISRISLLAPQNLGGNDTYLAGTKVNLRLRGTDRGASDAKIPAGSVVNVTLPVSPGGGEASVVPVKIRQTPEGNLATFTQTDRPGTYAWQMAVPGRGPDDKLPGGTFSVNAHGAESKLQSVPAEDFKASLEKLGFQRTYVAPTVAAVNQAAGEDAQGRNWWDLLLAAVILLLVAEAVVANRFRKRDDDIVPAHLNPRIAA